MKRWSGHLKAKKKLVEMIEDFAQYAKEYELSSTGRQSSDMPKSTLGG